MQITKREIRKLIQSQLLLRESEIFGTDPAPSNMSHLDASPDGDTGLTPEIRKFLFQGQPTEELHESVNLIVSEFEDNGIKFASVEVAAQFGTELTVPETVKSFGGHKYL